MKTPESDGGQDMSAAGQLPLDLPSRVAQARDDLVISDANRSSVAFLDSWPDWPSPFVILAGPVGSGKTHLAHVWAQLASARLLNASDLSKPPSSASNIVLEDVRGGTFEEASLFHLLNATRSAGHHVLMTSRTWPVSWNVTLPDLASRLRLAHVVELFEPDDDLLKGVLLKLFADRQITVQATVIDYCAVRMERSLGCAQDLVNEIDRRSLAQQRPVTIPLANKALKELGIVG